MIAGIKRPEWIEEECRNYGAASVGDEALTLAAAIAGMDGEQLLRGFLAGMFTSGFSEAVIASTIDRALRVPRSAAAKLLLSVMQSDFRDVLPLIRRPTLCIGGKESHLGPAVMPWIASRIAGAKVVMMDGRHFLHLEQPSQFNAAVRTFLEENLVSPGKI